MVPEAILGTDCRSPADFTSQNLELQRSMGRRSPLSYVPTFQTGPISKAPFELWATSDTLTPPMRDTFLKMWLVVFVRRSCGPGLASGDQRCLCNGLI